MNVKAITTDEEHKTALAEVESLMSYDPAPEAPLGQYLRELVSVVEAYEKKRWPIEKPTSEERAAFRAEQEKI
jgi:HTH-type transcriptional regulator/antitoxin HigA